MIAGEQSEDARLVRRAGIAVIALHLAYAAVTIAGFLALPQRDAPIADPWFAAMEWLIILIGPCVLLFFAAFARVAAGRTWSLCALVLAAVTFALSAALHAVILAVGRDDALVAAVGALSFVWPSAAYAIDILAWDWFFGLALLCAGMALPASPRTLSARRVFLLAGALALAGLAGPATGAMELRNVGILGYAVLFPVAVALVLRDFGRAEPA
ncbi:MAG: hypothetical protein V2I74_13750 [Erythrobacter sp.]|jgi:hypothetical protein|nr:hypothetical protein [Erythrobacter sp.]